MKMVKKTGWPFAGWVFLVVFLMGLSLSAAGFADTITTTTTTYPYFRSSPNPFAAIFYFVGDVLALPFRLLGDLFS